VTGVSWWDRSRSWRIERCDHHYGRVRVRFASARPTIAELAAVRRAFPQFADLPPPDLRARLDAAGELDLGEVGLIESRSLVRAAAAVGLAAVVEPRVETSYLIIDVTDPTPVAHLIEFDDELKERTVAEMIAAGVPVISTIVE
jgi:hypothetical protein